MSKIVNQDSINEVIKSRVQEKENKIVAFTQELVRTKSVNGQDMEAGVANILIPKLKNLGFSLEVVEVMEGRPNIVATFKGSKPGPRFLCYSHMDTVHE